MSAALWDLKLTVSEALIIGHSTGGKAAAALALYYSERVYSVYLLY